MSGGSIGLVLLPDDSVRVVFGEGDHSFEEEDLEGRKEERRVFSSEYVHASFSLSVER